MIKLFHGMFRIDFYNEKEVKYWAAQWNITPAQVSEAAEIAVSHSVNGMQQVLYRLGYIYPPEGSD